MEFLKEKLSDLERKGLRRTLRVVEGRQSREISIDGKKLLNFCSNNYLGLADDPRLQAAAFTAIEQHGLGTGASRLVCGTMAAHVQLERKLAELKHAEQALVFNSGYNANVGIISALFGREDVIFSDRLNHASIIDGIILSGAKLKRYAHKDMASLETLLKATPRRGQRVIITDTVFSMDGDLAPLPQIVVLARRYGCSVMVDEAHALGVLGKGGRGAVEHFGLETQIDIQMGTLSKAVGVFGAYVCGSKELIDVLVNQARSFIYTTAMPAAFAAAAQKGIEIIESEPERRQQLWDNTHFMIRELTRLGFDVGEAQTPIIPIIVGEASRAVLFSQKLYEAGIFVSAIRPPTVPLHTSRLRLTLMATHRQDDLEFLLEHLVRIGKELCLL